MDLSDAIKNTGGCVYIEVMIPVQLTVVKYDSYLRLATAHI